MDPELFLPKPGEKPQEAVSQPEGSDGTDTPEGSESGSAGVVRVPLAVPPMSNGLKRFFDIQKALKLIPRKK